MEREEIVGAINRKVLILAISSNSTKSKNVVRELALASEEEKPSSRFSSSPPTFRSR